MTGGIRATLTRLIGAQVCLHASMTGFRMAGPLMALREGYSPMAVGVLLALFSLAQVFLALPSGRFADRHGLRRPVRLAVTVAVAGGMLAVVWPRFPVLCITAVLSGAAAGLTVIALQRHVGRLSGDATGLRQVFSWLAIGPSISNFLGPFLAGLLIDASGFRAAYALLALLPLLSWFWVARVVEHAPVPEVQARRSGSSWNLLKDPGFRNLLLVNWMLSSCWDVHTFVVPVLGHERGLSATEIGSVLGAMAIAATLVRLVMPMVSERLREGSVVGVAMISTALLFGVYPLAQLAWQMGVLSLLLGFALGTVQPMIMSTLHQITPSHRHGEALGLRSMAINGSSVVMPLMFGSAGVVIGTAGVFWLVGSAVGVGSRLAWKMAPGHGGRGPSH